MKFVNLERQVNDTTINRFFAKLEHPSILSRWRLFNDPMASGIFVRPEQYLRSSCQRLINEETISGISVKQEHPLRSSRWRLINDPMASGIFVNMKRFLRFSC